MQNSAIFQGAKVIEARFLRKLVLHLYISGVIRNTERDKIK